MANLTLMDLLQQVEADTTQVPRTAADRGPMWVMKPIIERMMIQNLSQISEDLAKGDTTNKATDIGKQTLNEIFGNKSAEDDSLQFDPSQDAIRRLQEGGLIGKQGRALVDRLTFDPSDTGPMFGENQTAEQDSLQRDAVDRLRRGGPFGKQGRRLRDWLEAQDWNDIFEGMQNSGYTSVGPLGRENENIQNQEGFTRFGKTWSRDESYYENPVSMPQTVEDPDTGEFIRFNMDTRDSNPEYLEYQELKDEALKGKVGSDGKPLTPQHREYYEGQWLQFME